MPEGEQVGIKLSELQRLAESERPEDRERARVIMAPYVESVQKKYAGQVAPLVAGLTRFTSPATDALTSQMAKAVGAHVAPLGKDYAKLVGLAQPSLAKFALDAERDDILSRFKPAGADIPKFDTDALRSISVDSAPARTARAVEQLTAFAEQQVAAAEAQADEIRALREIAVLSAERDRENDLVQRRRFRIALSVAGVGATAAVVAAAAQLLS